MWRCHDCRTQNAAGAGFCQSCGQPRRAAPGLVSVFFLLDRSIDPVALFPQLKGALREVKSHLRGIDSKPRLLITLIPIRLRLVVAGGPGALQSLGEVTFVEAVADARSGLSEMQRRITALRERSGGVPTIEFLFLPRSAEVLSFADRYLPEYRKWMGAEAPPGAGDSTPSLFHLFCNADLDRLRTEGGKASWTSRFTGFLSDLLSGFMPKSALPPAPMAMPSPPAGEPPACFAPAPPPAAPPPPTASSGRRSIKDPDTGIRGPVPRAPPFSFEDRMCGAPPSARGAPPEEHYEAPHTMAFRERSDEPERSDTGRRAPASPSREPVTFSAFAPEAVSAGQSFVIDVWAFLAEDREEVRQLAKDVGRGRIAGIKAGIGLERGARLGLHLSLPGFMLEDPVDVIEWQSAPVNASFIVNAPENCPPGPRTGTVTISCEGIAIGKLALSLEVARAASGRASAPARVSREAAMLRHAFASYSSKDRSAVFARIQGMQKVAPQLEVFLDVLTLRSGENWLEQIRSRIRSAEKFFLFWSANAQRSTEVEREWRSALEWRGLNFIDPIPLVEPSQVPPPEELSELHFNDAYLAFAKARRRRK